MSAATIARWTGDGYLIPVLPHVFAVGAAVRTEDTRLWELVLYAGPGACVSHGTAAFRRGWLWYPVSATHISTPRQITRQIPGVQFHSRRTLERHDVNGIPCTGVTQTALDLAATEDLRLVRKALATMDYQRVLDERELRAACGRGRAGSAKLLSALNAHMPQLALTRSEVEDLFLTTVCEQHGVPRPDGVNAIIHGERPDFYWRESNLVVEVDGQGNHGTRAQRRRDRDSEAKLRRHGIAVLRFDAEQVKFAPAQVAADLLGRILGTGMLG
ncbi:MAG: DUF559 domain-containing protein [Solirubrobacterales bacterium]|nr:DUF559 domain-containing protein [Solirubrobacterales bacterium]